jgi:enoyl-CoA hydratase/carnithine racemase
MMDQIRVDSAGDDHVAVVELTNPPHNFFSYEMIRSIGEALDGLDEDDQCRSVVLCAEGKHFCAGADFSGRSSDIPEQIYRDAETRLFRGRKPIVAAIQGAAVGGGLGLALVADFRIAAPEARFSVNFARLGFHQGFGLSVTLPRLVGVQQAARLLYTGERINGERAVAIGLADQLAPLQELRDEARALAVEIAKSAPLAVESIRATLRGSLADDVERASAHEAVEQGRLRKTADFAEGVRAVAERRPANFVRA